MSGGRAMVFDLVIENGKVILEEKRLKILI